MNGHEFRTVEAILEPRLSLYGVRRSSDKTVATGTFSRTRFKLDVHDVLFGHKGPLDDAAIDAVVARALREIESQVTYNDLTLSPEEFRARPDIVGALPDYLISGAVEKVLRQGRGRPYRMAELLYVMAVRGRVDYRDNGWIDGRDVLSWIQQRYTHVEAPPRQKGIGPRSPVEVIRTKWRPQVVLKHHQNPVPFAMLQFHKSLLAALHGREGSTAKATIVAHHVLGGIEGQRVIHASQLASGALSALRRVDDIGYLRWATVAKGITSVRAFTDEVADLISNPSQPLVWEPLP